MIITKDNAKVNMEIFIVIDDRPFDPKPRINIGRITEIKDRNFLYDDLTLDMKNVWGFYEFDKGGSVNYFVSEEDAKQYISSIR